MRLRNTMQACALSLSFFTVVSGMAYALDDFDCYSSDQRVWISGRYTTAADGSEQFYGPVQVTFDEPLLRDAVAPTQLLRGSALLDFSYKSPQYSLTLNASKGLLHFLFTPMNGASVYEYDGKVTCE